MRFHAATRPHDDTTIPARHWVVETDDYDDGLAEARAGVPEGWDLLYVRMLAEGEMPVGLDPAPEPDPASGPASEHGTGSGTV